MKTLIPLFFAAILLSSWSSSENTELNGMPLHYHFVGKNQNHYEFAVKQINDNNVAYIHTLSSSIEGFGGFAQYFRADNYRNKRLQFSARFKLQNVSGYFSIYLRVDGKQFPPYLAFDNMQNRNLKGTMDWQRKYIILEVPEDAQRIQFGTFISGTGEAWIDDFRFEEADPKEGFTDYETGMIRTFQKTAKKVTIPDDMPSEPRNVDFEETGN